MPIRRPLFAPALPTWGLLGNPARTGLLQFPEGPYEARAQTEYQEQQQKGLIGSGEMDHAATEATPVPCEGRGALREATRSYAARTLSRNRPTSCRSLVESPESDWAAARS